MTLWGELTWMDKTSSFFSELWRMVQCIQEKGRRKCGKQILRHLAIYIGWSSHKRTFGNYFIDRRIARISPSTALLFAVTWILLCNCIQQLTSKLTNSNIMVKYCLEYQSFIFVNWRIKSFLYSIIFLTSNTNDQLYKYKLKQCENISKKEFSESKNAQTK